MKIYEHDDEIYYYKLLKESEKLFVQLPKDQLGHTDFSKLELTLNELRSA